MKDTILNTIQAAIEQCLAAGQVSGLAVSLAVGEGPVETLALGADCQGTPLTAGSLFPLASITKLAVALALLRLADQGLLSVDDPLGRFAPEAAAARPGVTLKRLLTHSAGMPAQFPAEGWAYDETTTWPGMAEACLKIAPDAPPGSQVMYDNLGYGLLAVVLQRLTGDYHQAVKELVFQPLGLDAYFGEEPPRAPIYLDDPGDNHAGTPIAVWNSPFWRSLGEPWGGMMATPASAVTLLRAFTGFPATFLRPETAAAAIRDQAGGLGGGFPWQQWPHCPWGLGPEIILEGMQHWMDPGMRGGLVGHGGSSGCCVMHDTATRVGWSIHGTTSMAGGWFPGVFGTIRAAILEPPS